MVALSKLTVQLARYKSGSPTHLVDFTRGSGMLTIKASPIHYEKAIKSVWDLLVRFPD